MTNWIKIVGALAMLIHIGNAQAQMNKSTKLFVKNPDEVYLGALVKKSSINADKHELLAHELDSVWMLSHNTLHMERFAGGKTAYDATLQKILAQVDLSNFSSSSATFVVRDIADYEGIDLFFGQTMPVQDVLYTEQPHLTKKSNFVVHAEFIFLDFMMDFTEYGMDRKLNVEGLNRDDWGYIYSLGYGRKAIVLVETNLDRGIASRAVQEVINNGGDIAPETAKILAQCTLRAATFGTPAHTPAHEDDPLMHVHQFLQAPVTLKDFETPLSFSMIELGSYATFQNEY